MLFVRMRDLVLKLATWFTAVAALLLATAPASAAPGQADAYAVPDRTYHYLHVGDVLTAQLTVRNRGPHSADIMVGRPRADGFTFLSWTGCPHIVEGTCHRSLAVGSSIHVGVRMRLRSDSPASPHLGFTVADAADPNTGDDGVTLAICVYESHQCSRTLSGPAPFPASSPSPAATRLAVAAATAPPSAASSSAASSSAASSSVAPSSAAAKLAETASPLRGAWLATLAPALILLTAAFVSTRFRRPH
ncbi:hypothetical protein HDA40_001058 [Hamadaea flava]|uniref:DUF11 domain-containing protein n=1 Tax=Hamadaea flava TaxID=1742688 RepID=A0ABV8LP97_9ACTN|nr:hypothetical protein [Hamadaea flava]MCP2322551.1 hypothetical protein [Hamadaea flava]